MEYNLIGQHPSIEKIRELITMVSDTILNVLILGETGTGKEVVARLLHQVSTRKNKNFIKVNCAALPKNLLESELFGYERGAFTGAVRSKPGKFELASDGVIFLDEIGDMPMEIQAKLLEVLQSGVFNRLGGVKDVKVDTWVISSTNHDLEEDMKRGLFREDLYYRLNIIKIDILPLRERAVDIPLLTEHFIQKHARTLKMEEPFTLNSDLQRLFEAYHWPGNVRQLSSTILRLMVGDEPEKLKGDLLDSMQENGLSPPSEIISGPFGESAQGEPGTGAYTLKPLKKLKGEAADYIEKRAISHALNLSGWNKRHAAGMLKISYKTLFYKMNQLGIDRKRNVAQNSINEQAQEKAV